MDTLQNLVLSLSNKEYKAFQTFLKSRNKRKTTHNIALLKAIKTDDIINFKKEISKKENGLSNYHSLRKRLKDSILEYYHLKIDLKRNPNIVNGNRHLELAKVFIHKKMYTEAFANINSAEALGMFCEDYHLVLKANILKLEYAHVFDMPIDAIETTINEYQHKISEEYKMTYVYALLRKKLYQAQYKKEIVNISSLIQETLKVYQIDFNKDFSLKILHNILFIANEFAAIYQDFSLIETYIKLAKDRLKGNGLNDLFSSFRSFDQLISNDQDYLKNIQFYLGYYYLRNRDWENCASFLNQGIDNKEYGNFLSHQFYPFNFIRSLYNFYLGNIEDAISTASEILEQRNVSMIDIYKDDIVLSLVMYYSFNNDDKSLYYLSKLLESDAYYERQYGIVWAIRKYLMEIMVHIQFGNEDFALSRIQSFKKKYTQYLHETNEVKVIEFLHLIEQSIDLSSSNVREYIITQLQKMLDSKEYQDLYNRTFVIWLLAYVTNKDYYTLLVSMI